MKSSRLLSLVLSIIVVAALAPPSFATDESVQTVSSGAGGTDEVWVGLASDGSATAVWTENGGVFASKRPSGGGFAPGKKIPGSDGPDQVTFHQAPNGNAVVAWTTGFGEGDLMASVRIGTSGDFGPAQVLAAGDSNGVQSPDSSISDGGRAAVVWHETNAQSQAEIRGALSSAAGTFAQAQTLATDRVANPRVDMSDAGDVIAVWDLDDATGDEIQTASAPRGGGFGQVQTLEALEQGPGEPDVAVNAGGTAVVVWEDFRSTAQGGSNRDVIEARYGNASGTFAALQQITAPDRPMATLEQEAAIDNAGRAAVIFSANIDGTSGIFASVSDAAGTFAQGQIQPLSHASSSGGGSVRRAFEVAAGGGEFTAFWTNDPNADGVDEAYHATTSAGTFGAPHQVSPTSSDQMTRGHGARNSGGEILSAWVRLATNAVAQVAPAAAGEVDSGTDGDDELSGTSGDDTIRLLGGNDLYNAGGGNDSVYGDAGDDQLAGGAGNDLLDGGSQNDQLIGGAGGDTLKGAGGSDTLQGDGVNAISGSRARAYMALSGPDLLFGGGGADKLIGGGGFDRFNGGPGRDVCHVDSRREKRRAKSCETIRLKRSR